MKYIALTSFTTTALPRYDVQKGEILDEDFAPADMIADLLAAKYIEEYNGGGGSYDDTELRLRIGNLEVDKQDKDLIVNVSYNPQTEAVSVDKTYSQIVSAVNSGKDVKFVAEVMTGICYYGSISEIQNDHLSAFLSMDRGVYGGGGDVVYETSVVLIVYADDSEAATFTILNPDRFFYVDISHDVQTGVYSADMSYSEINERTILGDVPIAVLQGDAFFCQRPHRGVGVVEFIGIEKKGASYSVVYIEISDSGVSVEFTPFAVQTQSQDGWRFKKYGDNTFEAWYSATGQSVTITNASGNLYRSELMTLTLPLNLTNGRICNISHAQVNVAHNNYPVFGTLANIDGNNVKYYAMSGGSRSHSPNYIITAYVYGSLPAL